MVWVHMDLGDVALCRGAYQEAIQHYRESVEISRELSYTNGLAFSLSGSGWILCDLGAYQEAKQYYQEALAAYRAWGRIRGISWSLAIVGYLAILLAEQPEAERYLQESLRACRQVGDEAGPWWYHCVQGELAFAQGAYSQAEGYFRQSLALYEDIGDIGVLWGAAWSLKGLGKTACILGAYRAAREQFNKALRSAMAVPSIPEALDILVETAALLVEEEKKEQATKLLAHALHNSAARKMTKDRAARLLAELEAKLPLEVMATAVDEGGKAEFELIYESLEASWDHERE
jgi:tetratricopeptide (TPR) repeat protein